VKQQTKNEDKENMAAALPLRIYLSEGQRNLREWRRELACRIPEWARRAGQDYNELVTVWSEVQRTVELIMGRTVGALYGDLMGVRFEIAVRNWVEQSQPEMTIGGMVGFACMGSPKLD